jgi:hypothetical protein
MLKLARRREPNDDAFFAKLIHLLETATAEAGEPTMQDPFGAVVIAVREHLEQAKARTSRAPYGAG